MVQYNSAQHKRFAVFNYVLMTVLLLSCILPMVNVLATSLSSPGMLTVKKVGLLPIGFTLDAYKELLNMSQFTKSITVSVLRVVIGTIVNLVLITLTAYPLSRESDQLKGRNLFMWFLVVPILFSGGLIPTFLWIRDLHLLNSFWVMILPGALPIFSTIMMMNFFRNLPKGIYEAAMIDGAGHLYILLKIFIPLSSASIATLSLFSIVAHWNSWFDAVMYINDIDKWPLQAIMRGIISRTQDLAALFSSGKGSSIDVRQIKQVSQQNLTAAAIIITIAPILISYPFLQKYFITGMVAGSVKE